MAEPDVYLNLRAHSFCFFHFVTQPTQTVPTCKDTEENGQLETRCAASEASYTARKINSSFFLFPLQTQPGSTMVRRQRLQSHVPLLQTLTSAKPADVHRACHENKLLPKRTQTRDHHTNSLPSALLYVCFSLDLHSDTSEAPINNHSSTPGEQMFFLVLFKYINMFHQNERQLC